jgi:hypothetical protein
VDIATSSSVWSGDRRAFCSSTKQVGALHAGIARSIPV